MMFAVVVSVNPALTASPATGVRSIFPPVQPKQFAAIPAITFSAADVCSYAAPAQLFKFADIGALW